MKKIYLIPLLGLLLGACSNDDLLAPSGDNTNDVAEATGYLTVNISSPAALGSRAGDYQQGNGDYVDGSQAENKVNRVRFYFFNEGEACMVRKNPMEKDAYYSYIDWIPGNANSEEGGPNHDETVEKTLTTTLVFSKPDSGDDPNQVVAIINPTSEILQETGNLSLVTLRSMVDNYLLDGSTALNNNNFVMTNSVFATGNPLDAQYAQPISSTQIGKTHAEALADPVKIYVERIAARVDFAFGEGQNIKTKSLPDGSIAYDITRQFDPEDVSDLNPSLTPQTNPVDIYFKPEAWALASFSTRSNLIKEINPSWSEQLFGQEGNPWNAPQYHRSFWAINPDNTPGTYNWYSFNQITGTSTVGRLGNLITENSIYTLENANPSQTDAAASVTGEPFIWNNGMNPLSPTQVIFVGRLVNGQGENVTVCEFRGMQFTEAGLLEYVASILNVYSSTDNGTTGTRITANDLKLVTQSAWSNKAPSQEIGGRYYSYFTLSQDGEKKNWYYQVSPGKYQAIPAGQINQYIDDDLGNSHAKVWENGMTYYYYDIQHLGAPGNVGNIGIVRNHIYDTTVTKLIGFGTPVLDPNEIIYPEKPESDKNNIATTINILSWRIVTTGYDVEWP